MRCFCNFVVVIVLAVGASMLAQAQTYNLGRAPTDEEIHKWDIAIGPEGKELPAGRGTAREGGVIFAQRCSMCHGKTGVEGPAKVLIGGRGTIGSPNALKTVGSFWPFATTVWDYINRAMPQRQEGTLTADQVYAVTAFLLFRNGIIGEDDVLDSRTLPRIRMPNRDGFYPSEPVWTPGMRRPFGYYPDAQSNKK
jgi:cytochrome c